MLYAEIGLNYSKKWKTKLLNFRYILRPSIPRLINYYDFIRVESRYNLKRGKTELLLNSGQNLEVEFKKSTTYPYFGLFANLHVNFERSRTIDFLYLDNNLSLTEWHFENQNVINLSLDGGIEKLFDKISSTFKVKPYLSFSKYQNYLENEFRTIKDYQSTLDCSFKSGWVSPINILIGSENSISSTNIISAFSNVNWVFFHSTQYIDFDIQIHEKIRLKWSNSFYQFKNRVNSKSNYFLSGLKVYFFPKNKKLNFSMRAHNLKNIKEITTFTSIDYLQITNNARIIPRYFLLSVGYRL